MRWAQISAVSWKEEGSVTLILISRLRNIARRLEVPGTSTARPGAFSRTRSAHDMHIGGAGLDLGSRAEGDAI